MSTIISNCYAIYVLDEHIRTFITIHIKNSIFNIIKSFVYIYTHVMCTYNIIY